MPLTLVTQVLYCERGTLQICSRAVVKSSSSTGVCPSFQRGNLQMLDILSIVEEPTCQDTHGGKTHKASPHSHRIIIGPYDLPSFRYFFNFTPRCSCANLGELCKLYFMKNTPKDKYCTIRCGNGTINRLVDSTTLGIYLIE